MGRWLVAALLALLLVRCQDCFGARAEPSHPTCHPDCTKYGNCADDGFCVCPFGRIGEACEIDFLAPCRQRPDGEALCSLTDAMSCECYKRCRDFFCLKDSKNRQFCHKGPSGLHDRPCYRWQGVPSDRQFSRIPEPEEEAKVKCFKSFQEDAPEVPCSEAFNWKDHKFVPLSKCKDRCHQNGYCAHWPRQPEPSCKCYSRSFEGASCERPVNWCFNGCNGRGTCRHQFCHCKPPYFSMDCSRSKVYPANYSLPNPADFKIYMYEMSTQLSFENAEFSGWRQFDENYIAYNKFMQYLLTSPVRTEDPSQADLFYIPNHHALAPGVSDHMHILIEDIRRRYPYWNRTNGKDHFFWITEDRGGCPMAFEGLNAIKVVHFGMYSNEDRHSPTFPLLGHKEYGCTHPQRDVVATPYDRKDETWLDNTRKHSLDDLIAMKKRYLFFAGSVLPDHLPYSGGSRQALFRAVQEWNDPEFQMTEGGAGGEYEDLLRTSKFCFAPLGFGYGMRLGHAMLAGCVPIIVQEYTIQQYEDVLPYETFSLRLNNEDMPHLRDILKSISNEQYRSLLQNVLRFQTAFCWNREKGCRAFDYTIASLRRKHLNFKAQYYGDYHTDQ